MTPLPCPFCGETSGEVIQTSTFRWRAYACSCGVIGPEIRVQTMGEGTPEDWEATGRVAAIEAWNTRTDPSPPNAHLGDQQDDFSGPEAQRRGI